MRGPGTEEKLGAFDAESEVPKAAFKQLSEFFKSVKEPPQWWGPMKEKRTEVGPPKKTVRIYLR